MNGLQPAAKIGTGMAEVTNDLIYETLKQVYSDLSDVKFDVRELKKRMTGAEEALVGMNRRLDRQDGRLERIERCLDLRQLAEPTRPGGYECINRRSAAS
ncbi:hypothetical protein [Mesorhizobium sp. IMUNJ 23232]|uniref:hypothetical protein n=1 Tax=Mesorhizobium sp. IMUNJ 23232 TaxID=3376064 RepID=UPI00378ED4E0